MFNKIHIILNKRRTQIMKNLINATAFIRGNTVSERRKQQWPGMKKAREEGKTAFFRNLNPANYLLTDIFCANVD